MKRRTLALLGFLTIGTLHAEAWERRSPDGAQAYDIVRAGSRLLLGTSGGLYLSSNDGSSWTRLASILPNQTVYGIAASPHDPDHWYVRLRETYVEPGSGLRPTQTRDLLRETRDGGTTWQTPALYGASLPTFHPSANRLMQALPNTYGYGWQYSGDGGTTWYRYSGMEVYAPAGLALPGTPFAVFNFSPANYWTAEFRLSGANGTDLSAPIASLTLSGLFQIPKLTPSATSSQALWVFPAASGVASLVGSVDFSSGQLVQLPTYAGTAYEAFDDSTSAGTVLLLARHQESYDYDRFGLSVLAPNAAAWGTRGSIERSNRGSPDLDRRPRLLGGDGGRFWLSDTSVGVHRSDDGGATWQVHNTGLGAAAVNAVLLDPRNPQHLLAGRDMQSLQRSVDGGLHWTDVGGSTPHDVRALARSPVDPDHILATARGGLYRSRDAGQTWQIVPTVLGGTAGAQAWHQLVWCANDDTHLLATAYRDLYRSADGGASWNFVRRNDYGSSFGLQTARQAPYYVYVSNGAFEGSERVLRTNDCGQSFVTIATVQSRRIAVSPYDSRIVAMTEQPPGYYNAQAAVSDDGGATWTLTQLPTDSRSGTNPLGWFDGCDTTTLTSAEFLTVYGTVVAPRSELPRQINEYAKARAADIHCINGRSVGVVGLGDGVWLHHPEIELFANGFDAR